MLLLGSENGEMSVSLGLADLCLAVVIAGNCEGNSDFQLYITNSKLISELFTKTFVCGQLCRSSGSFIFGTFLFI